MKIQKCTFMSLKYIIYTAATPFYIILVTVYLFGSFPFYSFPPTLLSPLSPAGELSPALLHLGDMRGWMRELLGMVKAFPHLLFYWRCALTSVGWRSGFSGFRVAAGRESAGPVIRTLQSGSGSSSCAVPLQGLSHTPTPLTTQANTAI